MIQRLQDTGSADKIFFFLAVIDRSLCLERCHRRHRTIRFQVAHCNKAAHVDHGQAHDEDFIKRFQLLGMNQSAIHINAHAPLQIFDECISAPVDPDRCVLFSCDIIAEAIRNIIQRRAPDEIVGILRQFVFFVAHLDIRSCNEQHSDRLIAASVSESKIVSAVDHIVPAGLAIQCDIIATVESLLQHIDNRCNIIVL